MTELRETLAHDGRRKLDFVRKGFRYEGMVAGHRFYLTLSFYKDGRLGEIFIDLAKEGAELKYMYAQISMMASRLLQYGMPAEKLVSWWYDSKSQIHGKLTGTGLEQLDGIEVGSILDAIARILKTEVVDEGP